MCNAGSAGDESADVDAHAAGTCPTVLAGISKNSVL